MNIKNRLAKLEKQRKTEVKAGDVFIVRRVDYRAGFSSEVKEPPDAIPVKFVDMMKQEEATE